MSDWSSDVCSSDLVQMLTDDVVAQPLLPVDGMLPVGRPVVLAEAFDRVQATPDRIAHWLARRADVAAWRKDRKSVVAGQSVSVRVDLGGRRLIKTNSEII